MIPISGFNVDTAGKNIKIIAGTLKQIAGVWGWIDDASHNPLPSGMVVSQDTDHITVTYGFTAKKCVTVITTPDETFAKFFQFGASVGLTNLSIDIRRHRVLGGRIYWNGSAWAQDGVSDIFALTYYPSTNRLGIVHESCDANTISVTPRNGILLPVIVTTNPTIIVLEFYSDFGTQYVGGVPTTNMDFHFIRTGWLKANPGDTTIGLSAGNIWIFGIFEI